MQFITKLDGKFNSFRYKECVMSNVKYNSVKRKTLIFWSVKFNLCEYCFLFRIIVFKKLENNILFFVENIILWCVLNL